jgi:hypothetical protein
VSVRPPLPLGWSWRFPRAVFRAGAPVGPSRLACVFVTKACAERSTVVPASETSLRDGSGLRDGRNLARSLAWLVERGFVTKVTPGSGRRPTLWSLAPVPERVLADSLASVLRRELDAALGEAADR